MHLKIVSFSLLAVIFILSCSTAQENATTGNYINPNGSSELAILMNQLYAEAEQAKQDIELGKKPKLKINPKRILTADATEPDKVASATYKAFAGSYIESVKMYNRASAAEAAGHFKLMVTACINCHKTLCPGPTKRIQKLLVSPQL